jgi:hypothetical protein
VPQVAGSSKYTYCACVAAPVIAAGGNCCKNTKKMDIRIKPLADSTMNKLPLGRASWSKQLTEAELKNIRYKIY